MSAQPQNPTVDPVDDEQLTIRIPNPKMYMARQSLWIGRRGKPRCDNCRANNLKCDRVLPVCNHCSWANNGECIYTPLPTPAHRGIPRCDRCRVKNIKCDRNLPICNNCSEEADGSGCNYTPKKRNKPRAESESISQGDSSGSWLKIGTSSSLNPKAESTDENQGHSFYGHNVAVSRTRSMSPSGSETVSDFDGAHTGRFAADVMRPSRLPPEYSHGGTQRRIPMSPVEFIPHPFSSDQRILVNSTHIEPWMHPSFPSLPTFVCQRLRLVDPIEMPNREIFDKSLSLFLEGMMGELKETACLSLASYKTVAHGLETGDITTLSARLQAWIAIHRLRSGSDKRSIILVPRDSIFSVSQTEAETYRRRFVADLLDGGVDSENLQVHHYDRLPLQNQLYDILTYAHRSHLPAAQMLVEVVRLRFAFVTWPMAEMYVRSCPLCKLRSKQESPHSKSSSQSPPG